MRPNWAEMRPNWAEMRPNWAEMRPQWGHSEATVGHSGGTQWGYSGPQWGWGSPDPYHGGAPGIDHPVPGYPPPATPPSVPPLPPGTSQSDSSPGFFRIQCPRENIKNGRNGHHCWTPLVTPLLDTTRVTTVCHFSTVFKAGFQQKCHFQQKTVKIMEFSDFRQTPSLKHGSF